MEARRNLSGARVGTSGLRPRSRDVIMIILSSCALKLRLPFSAGRASSRAYPPQLRRDPRSLVKRRWIHFFDDVWRRSFAYFDPANLTSRIWPMSPTLVDHAQDACAFRINFSADFVAPHFFHVLDLFVEFILFSSWPSFLSSKFLRSLIRTDVF